jgi:hypothetical protein
LCIPYISQHDKVLWPSWEKGKHNLRKTIFMPELVAIASMHDELSLCICLPIQCLVYFQVEADKKLFGQNCIPVISLQPGTIVTLLLKLTKTVGNATVVNIGIKFIPLRTPGGELIPGSGLFVQIKKTAGATEPETSSRNAADLEDTLSKSQGRRISRQQAIDTERGTIRDITKVAVKYGERNEENDESDEREEKFDSEDPTASYKRRFTSPASLESSPGDPFKEYDSRSKLIVVAEVHENTAL